MSDSECTIDAAPSPPRDTENVYSRSEKKPPKSKTTKDKEKNDGNSNFMYNNKASQAPVFNMIQLINSHHAHVGHVINYTISNEPRQENIKETEQMVALKNSRKPVLDMDIDAVKDHVGHGYNQMFLKLGFKQGEIDQNEMEYHKDKKGLIRWLLVDWKQANGKDATVGLLANALWDSNQRKALEIWSLKYDQLHK